MAFICLELPSEEPCPSPKELNMDFIPKSLLSQTHGYRATPEAAWGPRSKADPLFLEGFLRVPAAGGMEKGPGHVLVSRMSSLTAPHNSSTPTPGAGVTAGTGEGALRAGTSPQMVAGSPRLPIIRRKTK